MKYGLIRDGKCIYYGNDDGEVWQGRIEYNENGERLTAAEMIAKYQLKPIITPSNFNGRYSDYNAVEQNGNIVIANMIPEIKTEHEKAAAIKEALRNDKLLCDGDYKWTKYNAAKALGNDLPYTENFMIEFEIERQSYRDKIKALEVQYGFKIEDVKAGRV